MRRLVVALILLIAVAGGVVLMAGPGAQASPGATVTVNSTGGTNSRDNVLTLREAMLLATGGLGVDTLDSGECAQVSNSTYGPPCSTTDSIGAASADTIVFNSTTFPPGTPATITLSSTLPTLSTGNDTVSAVGAGVIVDGVTKAFDCFLISGEASDDNAVKGLQINRCLSGVRIEAGSDSNTIGGTTASERNVISGNSTGVLIRDSGTTGNVVKGNYIGTNAMGGSANPNVYGIHIGGGARTNTVGGYTSGERNVISGNSSYGIWIEGSGTDGNTVKGNYIGLNPWGTSPPIANEIGVLVSDGAQNNILGGNTAGERNVVSGNTLWGLQLDDVGTRGNTIKGNYIGTNPAGEAPMANVDGVYITAQGNTVGGNTVGDRNVISGNGCGVLLGGSENTVTGNYIGTNAAGTAALPNDLCGVGIHGQHNIVGGNSEAERNVISGNENQGVYIYDWASLNNEVKGNYIGTNAAGDSAIPNATGVRICSGAHANIIGGSTAGERNVISGNTTGVLIHEPNATSNVVKGNYIGTNAAGTGSIGNWRGVSIMSGAQNNAVGGSTAGDRNIVSGNYSGVYIADSGTNNNMVKGNYIGTNAAGTAAVGNGDGVYIEGGAQSNGIGGAGLGEGNVIAYSTGDGVRVDGIATTGNSIRGNSIHSNGGKGIENVNGGNRGLDPPIIDGVGSASGHTNPKCYPCTVEVFSDNEDEGRIYHDSTTTNDDATGTWTYPGAVTGPHITTTATHADGNTSEFSAPLAYYPPVGGIAELPDVSGSSGPNHIALAGGLATALLALTAGGWYARRRWLG